MTSVALLGLAACGSDATGTPRADDTTAALDGSGDTGNVGGGDSGAGEDSGSGVSGGGDSGEGDSGGLDTTPQDPADDGGPCRVDADCVSGFCLGDDEGFPQGMCTVFDCASRADCFGVGTACLRGQFNGNLCVPLCTTDSDCREGYECVGSGAGSYCYPAFANDVLDPLCDSEFVAADDVASLSFIGGGGRLDRHRIAFDVSAAANSIYVLAWSRDAALFPDLLVSPRGTELRARDYANYLFTPLTLNQVSPWLVPATTETAGIVEPGRWSMEFGFDGGRNDDICYVVMEDTGTLASTGEAQVIDLNFYFVGADGLDAATAPDSEAFADLRQAFDGVYASANVSIGTVRYFDVSGDVLDRFRVIRSQDEVYELVKLSRQPGSTREALLSANVFFNAGFAGEMSSVLGVSTGIPGAAGVHGQAGTGLVFSSEYLNETATDGPRLVGRCWRTRWGTSWGSSTPRSRPAASSTSSRTHPAARRSQTASCAPAPISTTSCSRSPRPVSGWTSPRDRSRWCGRTR